MLVSSLSSFYVRHSNEVTPMRRLVFFRFRLTPLSDRTTSFTCRYFFPFVGISKEKAVAIICHTTTSDSHNFDIIQKKVEFDQ